MLNHAYIRYYSREFSWGKKLVLLKWLIVSNHIPTTLRNIFNLNYSPYTIILSSLFFAMSKYSHSHKFVAFYSIDYRHCIPHCTYMCNRGIMIIVHVTLYLRQRHAHTLHYYTISNAVPIALCGEKGITICKSTIQAKCMIATVNT